MERIWSGLAPYSEMSRPVVWYVQT